MAVYKLHKENPELLTPLVLELFIQQKCIIPMFWIEGLFYNQAKDKCLPEGSLEVIISHGLSLYEDDMKLTVPFVTKEEAGSHESFAMEGKLSLLFTWRNGRK